MQLPLFWTFPLSPAIMIHFDPPMTSNMEARAAHDAHETYETYETYAAAYRVHLNLHPDLEHCGMVCP